MSNNNTLPVLGTLTGTELLEVKSGTSWGDLFTTTQAIANLGTPSSQPVTVGSSPISGGTNGAVVYNNAGIIGNFTVTGDATLNTSTGALTVTKTSGSSFGALATVTPGANVATALSNALNASGGVVGYSGSLGTPSSGVATNLTGTASGLTAGSVSTINSLVSPGTGVTLTGAGTIASPYLISATGSSPALLGITRSQIASYNLSSLSRFLTLDGAPWVQGSSSGPNAIQDLIGTWWQLDASGGVFSAKWFGAKGDGVTNDTAALQAAADACFGSSVSPNGLANATNNVALYIPPGKYLVHSPILLTHLVGGLVIGAGRFVTTIQDVTGSGCFTTNGCARSYFANMTLKGQSGVSTIFNLDWDNSAGGNALQSNTFQNMDFDTGYDGLAIGGTGYMGSENSIINCFPSNCTHAGVVTYNYNALQNTMFGGNVQSCGIGVYMFKGSISCYSTGFQVNTTFDFQNDNSAYDALSIYGCRSESVNFCKFNNGVSVAMSGCTQTNPNSGIFAQVIGSYALISGCQSVNGQVTGNTPARINISACNFVRSDWLIPGSFVLIDGYGYSHSRGTINSGTLTLDLFPYEQIQNRGAFALAPQDSTYASIVTIEITNGTGAGAIDTSAYTKVSGAFDTTVGHVFRCTSSVGPGGSVLTIQNMF